MSSKFKVGVVKLDKPLYPEGSPYNPSMAYPEYPFHQAIAQTENLVYDAVRKLFFKLGYDAKNYNKPQWNPLGFLIEPCMSVVIKPNFVLSKHAEGKDLYSIITHPSILRAITDYCWIALKGKGRIIIVDAPQYNCDFRELLEKTKLDKMCGFYKAFEGPAVEYLNLQPYWSKTRHFPSCIRNLPGDPQGSVTCDLGTKSALYDCPNPARFYGAVYHRHESIAHHSNGRNEYEISKTILSANVFISAPKLKVHKKVGVTLNGKGLVGICTNKNLIIHYRLGTPSDGGDQFPDGLLTRRQSRVIKFERWMYDIFLAKQSVFFEMIHRFIYGFLYLKLVRHLGYEIPSDKRLLDAGNWYGNDSAWRMVVDLYRIIYFADKYGTFHDTPQRKIFSIIDGVIGGENKGPLIPDPKPAGILLGGEDLIATDLVATRLMGFDPNKIKQFSVLNDAHFNFGVRSFSDIEVVSDEHIYLRCLENKTDKFLFFVPYPGWVGHIEV